MVDLVTFQLRMRQLLMCLIVLNRIITTCANKHTQDPNWKQVAFLFHCLCHLRQKQSYIVNLSYILAELSPIASRGVLSSGFDALDQSYFHKINTYSAGERLSNCGNQSWSERPVQYLNKTTWGKTPPIGVLPRVGGVLPRRRGKTPRFEKILNIFFLEIQ